MADRYAAHIEGDLDVTVSVHDLAASSLGAGSVLAALRGESSPYPSSVDVAGLVREAEVVVVYGNSLESISETHGGDWNCVSRTAPYARVCAAEIFDAYRADLGANYEEIFKLRGDEPGGVYPGSSVFPRTDSEAVPVARVSALYRGPQCL